MYLVYSDWLSVDDVTPSDQSQRRMLQGKISCNQQVHSNKQYHSKNVIQIKLMSNYLFYQKKSYVNCISEYL